MFTGQPDLTTCELDYTDDELEDTTPEKAERHKSKRSVEVGHLFTNDEYKDLSLEFEIRLIRIWLSSTFLAPLTLFCKNFMCSSIGSLSNIHFKKWVVSKASVILIIFNSLNS